MSSTTHTRVDIATNKILSYVAHKEGRHKKEIIRDLVFDKYGDLTIEVLEQIEGNKK